MSRHYIFCLMGKSAAGKDTIYREIRKKIADVGDKPDRVESGSGRSKETGISENLTGKAIPHGQNPILKEVVPYTTRPIRTGEENGKTYFFETDSQFESARAEGKIIESRDYNTVYGIWHYYTKDDGQIDLARDNYLLIGTLDTYLSLRNYYGADHVIPLYIELEDGERLQRALNRERKEPKPHYAEMCRRFLADTKDFSDENLEKAGIRKRFQNDDFRKCTEEVWNEILTLSGNGANGSTAV